jgi:hypothetical protein
MTAFATVFEAYARTSVLGSFGTERGYIDITPTLAMQPANPAQGNSLNYLIHANLVLTARRGTENVSASFYPFRVMRVWEVPVDGVSLEPAAGAVYDAGDPKLFLPDTSERSIRSRNSDPDAPGSYAISTRVTGSTRTMREFWFGWCREKFDPKPPPFGGIYYVVCTDIAPARYRVRVSRSRPLTGPEFATFLTWPETSIVPLADMWWSPAALDAMPGGWVATAIEDSVWATRNALLPLG